MRSAAAAAAARRRRRLSPAAGVSSAMVVVDGVTARAADGTALLDDVSFSLRRGWLVAVVGPTGAGKTSLANVLSGMAGLEAGTIHLDGLDVATADAGTRRRVAYVPQDDLLHASLDLRRTLGYAASLRSHQGHRGTLGAGRVDAVLDELGLQGCAHLPISVLSGGERKRANVAVELVADPEVLVLDEPTAGLDPGFEKSVFATLRQLADRGRTVVVVTHSVRALPVCDRVLFLAPGGRVAFFGPPRAAARYFAQPDPADVFLALHDQPGRTWQERFRSHPAYARYVNGTQTTPDDHATTDHATTDRAATDRAATVRRIHRPAATHRPPGRRCQLVTLLRRHLDLMRADRRNLTMLAVAGPLLGLLLWAVLTPGGLHPPGPSWPLGPPPPDPRTIAMFLAVSATWLGAANAIREIVKERRIVRREHRAGMSLGVYLSSKFLAIGAVTVSQVVFLTLVATARQDPPGAGAVLGSGTAEIATIAALTGLAAVALGLLLSALVSSPEKAMTILPFVLVTQLVFAGPWTAISTTPGLRELRALTGAHWGGQAIQATVTGNATAWWTATATLLALTIGALTIAHTLLHHHNRPPQETHPPRPTPRCDRPRTHPTPSLRPTWALGATALVLLSGLGTVAVAREAGPNDQTVSALVAPASLPAPTTPSPVPPAPGVPTPPPPVPAPPVPSVPASPAPANAVAAPAPSAVTAPVVPGARVVARPTDVPAVSIPPAVAVTTPPLPAAVVPAITLPPAPTPAPTVNPSPDPDWSMLDWWILLAAASSDSQNGN
jgi:ABC-type multidrug transport system ATPase subunit